MPGERRKIRNEIQGKFGGPLNGFFFVHMMRMVCFRDIFVKGLAVWVGDSN